MPRVSEGKTYNKKKPWSNPGLFAFIANEKAPKRRLS
jgi:hypothetical protein